MLGMRWIEALKIWNGKKKEIDASHVWATPRRDTPEHAEVKEIQNRHNPKIMEARNKETARKAIAQLKAIAEHFTEYRRQQKEAREAMEQVQEKKIEKEKVVEEMPVIPKKKKKKTKKVSVPEPPPKPEAMYKQKIKKFLRDYSDEIAELGTAYYGNTPVPSNKELVNELDEKLEKYGDRDKILKYMEGPIATEIRKAINSTREYDREESKKYFMEQGMSEKKAEKEALRNHPPIPIRETKKKG